MIIGLNFPFQSGDTSNIAGYFLSLRVMQVRIFVIA
jgi:hypothetical protein